MTGSRNDTELDFMTQLHAKTGPEKGKRRGRRPGLRGASNGIGCRAAVRFADEAAEQLRQAAQLLVRCRFEHRGEDLGRVPREAITGKTKRYYRVVVRPDRAVVIGNRIESRLAARDRSDPPSTERIPAKQCLGDACRPFRRGDPDE